MVLFCCHVQSINSNPWSVELVGRSPCVGRDLWHNVARLNSRIIVVLGCFRCQMNALSTSTCFPYSMSSHGLCSGVVQWVITAGCY